LGSCAPSAQWWGGGNGRNRAARMAGIMSFEDLVSGLVAEHERLLRCLRDLTRENGSLRERLLTALGTAQETSPSEQELLPSLAPNRQCGRGVLGPLRVDTSVRGLGVARRAVPLDGTESNPLAQAAEAAPPAEPELAAKAAPEEAGVAPEAAEADAEYRSLPDSSKGGLKLTGDLDLQRDNQLALPSGCQLNGRRSTSEYSEERLQADGKRGPAPLASYTPRLSQLGSRDSAWFALQDYPPALLDEWLVPDAALELSPGTERIRSTPLLRTPTMLCGEAVVDEQSALKNFVVRPNSVQRSLWDSLSVFILGYDIVYIPLEVFSFDPTDLLIGMEWFTTVFWTADILFNFITGFHHEGLVEMRPSAIARRYLRSGFPLDFLVVLVDWILAIFTFGVKAVVRVGKTARAFRLLRVLRTLRLLRSVKLHRLLTSIFHNIKSDLVRTMASILMMLLGLVVFNHYFACGWYALSLATLDGGWMYEYDLDPEHDKVYCYWTALHWSLTQFTPASMEVYPSNLPERVYTVLVLLFALVTFSSFVSGITSSLMYLRKLKTEPAQQEAVLRQYFQDSKISAELGQRIWLFLQNSHFQYRKRVHRADLPLLHLVPESLKDMLSEELYLPVLSASPLFEQFGALDEARLYEVSHKAMGETALVARNELFSLGKAAEKMYFLTSGALEYQHREMALCATLHEGQWISEPVLWMSWVHCGKLSAFTSCEIVDLHAAKFRELACTQCLAHDFLRAYARAFHTHMLNSEFWCTDLWLNTRDLADMAHTAAASCMPADADAGDPQGSVGTNGADHLAAPAHRHSNHRRLTWSLRLRWPSDGERHSHARH